MSKNKIIYTTEDCRTRFQKTEHKIKKYLFTMFDDCYEIYSSLFQSLFSLKLMKFCAYFRIIKSTADNKTLSKPINYIKFLPIKKLEWQDYWAFDAGLFLFELPAEQLKYVDRNLRDYQSFRWNS